MSAMVEVRAPVESRVGAADLAAAVAAAPSLPPFHADLVATCARISAGLLAHPASRSFPELVALASWLRPAEARRLAAAFASLEGRETVLVPRGVAFHLPPANVDTIAIYSWALSLLVGNRNLVRLSRRVSAAGSALVEVVRDALAAAPAPVRQGTAFFGYAHEDAATRAFSARCDLRVVWGGDAAVEAIRKVGLPPHAVELTFPDRRSLAILSAHAWEALGPPGQKELAERFFADASWFGQLACASPRLVAWVGTSGQGAGRAFFARVAEVARERGWAVPTATALAKGLAAYRAILDLPVEGVFAPSNEVTVVELAEPRPIGGEHPGGGLFYQVCLPSLDGLAGIVERRDQTAAHFGFSGDALRALVRALNGRGVDRLVPIGRALAFDRYWDGLDLLQAFTRRVYVEVDR